MKKTISTITLISLAAGIFAVSGCSTVEQTGRKRVMLMSRAEEIQMGEEAFKEVLSTSKLSTNLVNKTLLTYLGKKLAEKAGVPDYAWEFALIDDDEQVNAFCLPGGKVAVYTGILPVAIMAGGLKDGLAVVIGHEIGHAIARHGAERMSQSTLANLGASVLGSTVFKGKQAAFMEAYGAGITLGVILPYSRVQEYEADYIGLLLMAKAGYNPEAAVKFWEKMEELSPTSGSGLEKYLSTHPPNQDRLKKIKEHMPEAMYYYNMSKK
jgi:metalloendopeptidase OMA1, mitochondrial